MKKLGLFGGSFDPIHHGHLILAREAMEAFALDALLFIPVAQSPHKLGRRLASADVRWEMLQAAIANEQGFSASPIELDRPPPSYSVETVERIQAENPESQLYFLIGEDNLPELPEWHRFEDLQRLVHFIVLDRSREQMEYSYLTVRRKIDISATAIRIRVAAGRSLRYLVPDAVTRIIAREKLYQGSIESNRKT